MECTHRDVFCSLVYVLLWYMFSLGMTFYNKWLFAVYNFHFPLTITSVHMFMIFCLSWIARHIRRYFWGCELPTLGMEDIFKKILPSGIAGALDIGLSNVSLMMISVTLYTMCKGSVLAFTLVFACIFRLERMVGFWV